MKDKRIDEIQTDEGEYFVELANGWSIEREPGVFAHCFGAFDKRELREEMKKVRRCKCTDCAK